MTAEWIAIILTAVCMIGGLVGQAIYITWHASRWNTTMEFMTNSMNDMKNSVHQMADGYYSKADAKDDLEKRDETIKKVWEKYDHLRDDFILLRGKFDAHIAAKGGSDS